MLRADLLAVGQGLGLTLFSEAYLGQRWGHRDAPPGASLCWQPPPCPLGLAYAVGPQSSHVPGLLPASVVRPK